MWDLSNTSSLSWKAVTCTRRPGPQGACDNPREINTFTPSEAQPLPLVKHRLGLGS